MIRFYEQIELTIFPLFKNSCFCFYICGIMRRCLQWYGLVRMFKESLGPSHFLFHHRFTLNKTLASVTKTLADYYPGSTVIETPTPPATAR
ncbi:hypothetical protein L1887_27670 [Cichorium endivia]|nr:hypothetical protein L1887_27670 [Cichorium endivia]